MEHTKCLGSETEGKAWLDAAVQVYTAFLSLAVAVAPLEAD